MTFFYDGPMFKKSAEDLVTIAQAAKMKGVSRSAIYLAIAEGRLPRQQVLGRLVLKRNNVEAWQPQPHNGRPKGIAMSQESKERISQGQRKRWLARRKKHTPD